VAERARGDDLPARPVASARLVVTPTLHRSGLRSARLLAAGTTLRIVLTPLVMWLVIDDDRALGGGATAAAVLFVVAAATDWIDGRLARRWGVTTKLGSFLDTTADKLLVSGVSIALLAVDRMSPWLVGVIIGRELVVMALRGVIATEGTVMQPSMLGKLKTSVQFLALLLAILRPGGEIAGAFTDEWVMVLAAAITVGSAVDYLARAFPALVAPSRQA
jgi:CDP-diacylglycerol--glycerol-3-phosphate 3-phosphatidyltransferase